MDYYKEVEKITLEIENKKRYFSAIGNIGILYLKNGDYDKAMQYFEKVKKVSLKFGDKMEKSLLILEFFIFLFPHFLSFLLQIFSGLNLRVEILF